MGKELTRKQIAKQTNKTALLPTTTLLPTPAYTNTRTIPPTPTYTNAHYNTTNTHCDTYQHPGQHRRSTQHNTHRNAAPTPTSEHFQHLPTSTMLPTLATNTHHHHHHNNNTTCINACENTAFVFQVYWFHF